MFLELSSVRNDIILSMDQFIFGIDCGCGGAPMRRCQIAYG